MYYRDYQDLLRSLGKECSPERFRQAVDAAAEMGENQPRYVAYQAYIHGTQWRSFRKLAIEAADDRCQRCGTPSHEDPQPLEVHHKHYETIGQESYDDVVVTCVPCHAALDPSRKQYVPRSVKRALQKQEVDDLFAD